MLTELDELYVIYSNIIDISDKDLFMHNGCNCFFYRYLNNKRIPRTTITKPTNFFNITIRTNAIKDILTKESFISFCYYLYKDFYIWKDCFKIFTSLYSYLCHNQDYINDYYSEIVNDYLNTYDASKILIDKYSSLLNDYLIDVMEAISNKVDLNISMDCIYKIKFIVQHCYLCNCNETNKHILELREKISKILASKINNNVNIYDKMCILVNNYIIDESNILLWMFDSIR